MIGKMNRAVKFSKDWLDRLFKRTAPLPTDAKKILTDWDAMQYGFRCHLALGGHKFAPPELSEQEVTMHATGIINMVANILVAHRAAEDVIRHHGLDEEYRAQSERAQRDVDALLGKNPTAQQESDLMAAIRAIQKAGSRNGKVHRFPGAGGEGNGMGEGRVPDHRGEGGPEVRR